MEDLDLIRRFSILRTSLQVTRFDFICPKCLRLLKDRAAITQHCLDQTDQTHRGLGLTGRRNFDEFQRCYQQAVGWLIFLSPEDAPGPTSFTRFFKIDFVLKNKNCEASIDYETKTSTDNQPMEGPDLQ